MKKSKEPEIRCSHTEVWDIDDLKPNPENPNQHSEAQLEVYAKVIAYNGWRRAVTVSKNSGRIVVGHGALMAARIMGWRKIPVDIQEYESEAVEYAALLADNRLPELSDMDREMLKDMLQKVDTGDLDMDMTGYDFKSLDAMMHEHMPEGKPEVEFTEELLLNHNYVVLYFDNELDWHVACDKFKLKEVKDLTPRKGQPTGIGRVIKGKDWLERIT